jgi:hypothetical protein
VPPGAVDEPVDLAYVPVYPPSHDTSPLVSPGYAFSLTIEADYEVYDDYTFAQPVVITVTYEDADIEVMDESTFVLGIWDEYTEEWMDAVTTCDPTSTYDQDLEANTLSVEVCRVGEFALLGIRLYDVYLPVVIRSSSGQLVEPVEVSLHAEEALVPAGRPVHLTTQWYADTAEYVEDYIDSLTLGVDVDGVGLSPTGMYWSDVEECGDIDKDGDADYVAHWLYPIGTLSTGNHIVESYFSLEYPVTDGYDFDEDGVPDLYSGSWEYNLDLTVGTR